MKKVKPINPYHAGFITLVNLIDKHINDKPSNTIEKDIESFLSFDIRLNGLNTFLQVFVKHPLAKSHFQDVKSILLSPNLLIKDKVNFIQFVFLPIYMEMTQISKKQAIDELYIPSAVVDSEQNYPLSDNMILEAIQHNKNDYFNQRQQLSKIIEITTNIVNLIITGDEEENANKYDGILSELQANTIKVNQNDCHYCQIIVNQIESILIEKNFDEEDMRYMICVIAILSHLMIADFFLLFNEFENQYLIDVLNRQAEIDMDLFHKINNADRLKLHDSVIKTISKLIDVELRDMLRDFPDEMQIMEEEQRLQYHIDISNQAFIKNIIGIFDKVALFNKAYQNDNFNILCDLVLSQSKNEAGQTLGFYLQSLMLIPHIFNNDVLVLTHYRKQWQNTLGVDIHFNLNKAHQYDLPLWINLLPNKQEVDTLDVINDSDEHVVVQDIIHIDDEPLPDGSHQSSFQMAHHLPLPSAVSTPYHFNAKINQKSTTDVQPSQNHQDVLDLEEYHQGQLEEYNDDFVEQNNDALLEDDLSEIPSLVNANAVDETNTNDFLDMQLETDFDTQFNMEEKEIMETNQHFEEANDVQQDEVVSVGTTENFATLPTDIVNTMASNKRTMGEKLNVSEITLYDHAAENIEEGFTHEQMLEVFSELLPATVFQELQKVDDDGEPLDMSFDLFNNMSQENSVLLAQLNEAQKEYDEDNFQSIYRLFHTFKGTMMVFRMILAAELAHKAAYLVDSIIHEERPINANEVQFLLNVLQTLYTLFVKLYYVYVREADTFIYYNEQLTRPIRYTVDVFTAHNVLTKIHGKAIEHSPVFKRFLNQEGYELVNDELYMIDSSKSNLPSNNETLQTYQNVTEHEQELGLNEEMLQHYVHHNDPNDAVQLEQGNPNVQHIHSVEIHKQPIIIELPAEHYLAHGIFVQSNDGYVVNQRQRISIRDWMKTCETIMTETDNLVDYFRQMHGAYIGVSDINSDLQYNINHVDMSLSNIYQICITSGLHLSGSLIADFIQLLGEYKGTYHHEFMLEHRTEEGVRNLHFNNHHINEELSGPIMVVDPQLIDFVIKISEYLRFLFNHNPLDGLNREDVELLKYQMHNYTSLCRHSKMMKLIVMNDMRRDQQVNHLSELVSKTITSIQERVLDIDTKNDKMIITMQSQDAAVEEMLNRVSNTSETQSTILNNLANGQALLNEHMKTTNNMIMTLGQMVQNLLGMGSNSSKQNGNNPPNTQAPNNTTTTSRKKFLGLF